MFPSGVPVPCNVSMVGLYGVGKTSLVRRYVHSIYSENYLPTMGVQISRKRVESGGGEVDFNLWDLEGKENRAQLQNSYLEHAHAYILVADVTRRVSLDTALELQEGIRKILPGAPFVLALNKSDLASEMEGEIARLNESWTIVRTSARTGGGVEEIFGILAERVLSEMKERLQERTAVAEVDRDPGEDDENEPAATLEISASVPLDVRVATAQPVRVPAGGGEIRVDVSVRGGDSGAPVKWLVSCRCPVRRDVRCLVARTGDRDRMEAVIEVPAGVVAGDEITCEFRVGGGEMITRAIRVMVA